MSFSNQLLQLTLLGIPNSRVLQGEVLLIQLWSQRLKPTYQDPIFGAESFPNRLSSGCCLQSCLVKEHPGSWATGCCQGSQISVSFPSRVHITKSLHWGGTNPLHKWRRRRKDAYGILMMFYFNFCRRGKALRVILCLADRWEHPQDSVRERMLSCFIHRSLKICLSTCDSAICNISKGSFICYFWTWQVQQRESPFFPCFHFVYFLGEWQCLSQYQLPARIWNLLLIMDMGQPC